MNTDENTMDQEDALLTAYALGELPAAERAKVEARLKSDPAAARQVETVRSLATMIADDLKAEAAAAPASKLSPSQRARVEASGAKAAPTAKPLAPAPQGLLVRFRLVAVAAGVLVVGGLSMTMTNRMEQSRELVASAPVPIDTIRSAPPTATEAPPSQQAREWRLAGADERPVIVLEEEVEVTSGVPKGADLGALADGYRRDLEERKKQAPDATTRPEPTATRSGPVDTTMGRGRPTGQQTEQIADYELSSGGVGTTATNVDPTADVDAPQVTTHRPPPPTSLHENEFKSVTGDDVRSTFSIDVDTASYSNVRRFLTRHTMPSPESVRLEEMINYFSYDYAPPTGEDPFAAHVEVTGSPFTAGNRLVRIGLKGRELEGQRPPCNLVFLLDVSGSMNSPGRMPLVKEGLKALVEQLTERDRVSIVVYSGASGLVLPATSGDQKGEVLDALNRLSAGGSTNAGAGIELAYNTAITSYVEGGVNRVILCTDGDFNVGIQNPTELENLIAQKAKSGVFLTVLGYECPPRGDARCEVLADRGNGNYAAIDGASEAKKVLVEQAAGTLVTIAKDVKIQVEWNPALVASYRLLGYENRVMSNAAFRDDAKDAGEIGLGHTVTALYEVVPAKDAPRGEPLVTVRLRYKQPEGDTAKELAFPATDAGLSFDAASEDTRFAAAVAGFGMLLRGSRHSGQATWALVDELAKGAITKDPGGRRAEMVRLIAKAREITGR
jgi:Ca-activated chloride channel family protein